MEWPRLCSLRSAFKLRQGSFIGNVLLKVTVILSKRAGARYATIYVGRKQQVRLNQHNSDESVT